MARYFFHLRDGSERLLDPQGLDIDDADQLASTALKEARALVAQDALQGKIDLGLRLEVEDEHGNLVHALRFADAVRLIGGPS